MPDPRPCLICGRPGDDYVHGPERSGAHDVVPRVEPHQYDPGERRSGIRRMDDRVKKIEEAL
jgi:hypothetical protein